MQASQNAPKEAALRDLRTWGTQIPKSIPQDLHDTMTQGKAARNTHKSAMVDSQRGAVAWRALMQGGKLLHKQLPKYTNVLYTFEVITVPGRACVFRTPAQHDDSHIWHAMQTRSIPLHISSLLELATAWKMETLRSQ